MIRIQGFSPLQRRLADEIWEMETKEEVTVWFDQLSKKYQMEAYVVLQMITLAVAEQKTVEDFTEANEVIERIKRL